MSIGIHILRLVQSSSHLASHVSQCSACRLDGTDQCGTLTELVAILRADVKDLAAREGADDGPTE